MNKVFLTGNVVNIRSISTPSGNLNAFVTISVLIWRKQQNPNQKNPFITVNFFDVSQNYVDNLKKARLVSIEGHVSTYNQKVSEEKIIKMLSIISDRCQILLYKKPKTDEIKDQNFDFKNDENDNKTFLSEKEETNKEDKKPPYSSDGELDNLEETIFLTDDGDLF